MMWDLSENLKKAFPAYLQDDIEFILAHTQAKQTKNTYAVYSFDVSVNHQLIQIPYRHTIENVIEDNVELSEVQYAIIHCFLTRSTDGFVRQYHLNQIIGLNLEWVVPFVFQLIGEYVIEILDLIYQHREKLDISLYKQFISENHQFYELTRSRVMSYWNEYYRYDRSKHSREDYVGFKILREFE